MKVKHKKQSFRALSLLLSASLLAGMAGAFPVSAQEELTTYIPAEEADTWSPRENAAARSAAGDLTPSQLATARLSEDELPAGMSLAEAQSLQHVHRLREQESDLSTVIFQNRDGTKTMYCFDEPVKYRDANGQVQDKDNSLVLVDDGAYLDGYRFTNKASDIRTYYPKLLDSQTGIVLEYAELKLELYPESAASTVEEPDAEPSVPLASQPSAASEAAPPAASKTEEAAAAPTVGVSSDTAETETSVPAASLEKEEAGTTAADSMDAADPEEPEPARPSPDAAQPNAALTSGTTATTALPTEPTDESTQADSAETSVSPLETRPSASAAEEQEAVELSAPAEDVMTPEEADDNEPLSVSAQPASAHKRVVLGLEGEEQDVVAYENVFGEGVSLQYRPVLSGSSEKLVLEHKPDTNIFRYRLKTNGLTLTGENGSFRLVDPLTGEQKASLSEPYIRDSAPSQSPDALSYRHIYTAETVVPDQEYRLTITVDPAYLAAESTQYPVTLSTVTDTMLFSAIDDITMYADGTLSSYSNQVLYVGNNNGNAARALIKVNSLWQNRDYLAIAGDVTEAYLRVRDLGCYATPTTVSYYTATSSWQEDTVTCSGRIWHPGTYVSCNTIYNSNGVDLWGNGSGNYYFLSLTDQFLRSTYGECAIMVKADNESQTALQLASSENSGYPMKLMLWYSIDQTPTAPAVEEVTLNRDSLTLSVGSDFYLSASVLPSGASSDLVWSSSNPSVAQVHLGRVCAMAPGTSTITVRCRSNSSVYDTCTVTVRKLLIYQSRQEYYGSWSEDLQIYTPAEDLRYNDKTETDLLLMDNYMIGKTADDYLRQWKALVELNTTTSLRSVALNMVDHFMEGSGTSYSNSELTQMVRQHTSSIEYVNKVTTQIKKTISIHSGDLSKMQYIRKDRYDLTLVKLMSNEKIYEPVFDESADNFNGLGICIHSLWGTKIEITSYSEINGQYTGTLHFTYYDHFGLDWSDLSAQLDFFGIRAWYILQHYTEFQGKYKPYLTLIEFDVPFSGNL